MKVYLHNEKPFLLEKNHQIRSDNKVYATVINICLTKKPSLLLETFHEKAVIVTKQKPYTVTLRNQDVESGQFTIAWSKRLKLFTCTKVFGSKLLFLVLGKKSLSYQLESLSSLLYSVQSKKTDVHKVQELELETEVTPVEDRPNGNATESSLEGHQLLLNSYLFLHASTLSYAQKAKLHKLRDVFIVLKQERSSFRKLSRDRKKPQLVAEAIKKWVEYKFAILNQAKEVFLLGGGAGHHVIVLITQEKNNRYELSIQNAGYKSEKTSSGQYIKAVQVFKIDTAEKIKKLIECYGRKMLFHATDKVQDGYDKVLKHILIEETDVVPGTPQHKGNCTTRSSRELQNYYLGPELTQKIRFFITKEFNEDTLPAFFETQQSLYPKQLRYKLVLEAFLVEQSRNSTELLTLKQDPLFNSVLMNTAVADQMKAVALKHFLFLIHSGDLDLAFVDATGHSWLFLAARARRFDLIPYLMLHMAYYKGRSEPFTSLVTSLSSLSNILLDQEGDVDFSFLLLQDAKEKRFIDYIPVTNRQQYSALFQKIRGYDQRAALIIDDLLGVQSETLVNSQETQQKPAKGI